MKARSWAATCLAAILLTCQAPSALALPAPTRTINVHVDPRVELAATVAALTPWAKENAEVGGSTYAAETLSNFGKYADHPAVKAASDWLSSDSGNLSVLMQLALSLNSDLTDSATLNPGLVRAAGGTDMAEHLAALLVKFAGDTAFKAWFDGKSAQQGKIEAGVADALAKANPAGRLEAYFGSSFPHYTVLLSPSAPRDNDHETLGTAETADGPVVMLRPVGTTRDKRPEFKEGTLDFSTEVTHAFGRAFIQPMTAKLSDNLNQSAALMKPIADDMRAAQIDTWPDVFSEHILRAIDARFMQEDGNGKQAQAGLRSSERAGFAFVRDMFDQLASFEADRTKYPTLDTFLPMVADKLSYLKDTGADEEIARRYAAFQGPLSKAYDKRYLASTVLVRPNVADPKLKAAMTSELTKIKTAFKHRYHKDLMVVSPEEAANLSPAKTAYIILGTPWSNPFLAALIKYVPLKVSKNTIQLGEKQFLGKNLRLITAFTNPYNPQLPMQIFTGTEDAGIPGMFAMPYGSGDYVVYHDDHAIAEGDFVYDLKGKWSLP